MLEEILHKGLNIDKRHWKPVRFGDVVMEPKETAKNLAKEGIEHVVGLDHIDSGDIHLHRYAGIEEATTFTKKFRKGDVLFGRRRAYLKKAAVAPFTGICSGDITVFRAQEGLLPALLPFLVNNDKFFDYAMKHSAGGLSPRVKFKDLANYELLLPPKEEQAQLAELLWANDRLIESYKYLLKNLSINEASIFNEYSKNAKKLLRIDQIGNVITGSTPSTSNKSFWEGKIPFVTPRDIDGNPYVISTQRNISEDASKKSRLIPSNSVMVVCIGSTIGKVSISKIDCCTNQQINTIVPHKGISPIFLMYTLKHNKQRILARSGTTAVPIINKSEFGLIKLPIITENEMRDFDKKTLSIRNAQESITSNIENSKKMMQTIRNCLF